MADAARAGLDAAAALARTGNRLRARELCASVLFEMQPIIAARAGLLRAALHALLLAHGCNLLSRMVLAMSGRSVQLVLLRDCAGPIAPPRSREEPGRTIYALDERWIDRLSPDDMFFRQWCDALFAQRHEQADLPAAAHTVRHLEPA